MAGDRSGVAQVFSVRHGRSLHWAPAWPCSEARVLFDARSGDHWILSATSAARLGDLMAAGRVTVNASPGLSDRIGSDELALLSELEAGGILQSHPL